MNSKKTTLGMSATIIVSLVCAALFALPAAAATMDDLMQYLPADAHIAVGLPDIEAVETRGAPLFATGPLSQISSLAVALGGDTLSEGLSNSGIRAAAPGAVFLSVASANDIRVSGVLMVENADTVKATMVNLLGGEGSEVALPGDLAGRFVAGSGVGYFLSEDKLFIASSEALLEQLAARKAAPAEVNYTAKDEVVIWSRIDTLQENNLVALVDQNGYLETLLNTIKPFSDEVILAIGEEMGQAYLRAAARDSNGETVPSPGTLALHGYMDADAPLLMNLRITPQLVNGLASMLSRNPATRQIGGYVRIASSLVGDEMAVSVRSIDRDAPDALIALSLKNASAVPNLLRMVAGIEAPTYQHEEIDVYVYETGDIDVNIAVPGETLVVAPGEAKLKDALAAFSKADASGAPDAVVNRGVHGFVLFDGAKANALNIDLPSGLDNANIVLTLGIDGPWREAVLTSPAGFDGLASVVQGLL